ncbi:PREDICTED: CLAVATA3/ESR (CLE)-related protein 26 [Ipomoea nil]|uniref:CLAVATA3/ESR (CLE)-related protein 26 n=1 Tax=Ipomoea nil TaxID=35883 RepID=UPI000900D695|nr:PREDICTED: CLAVATA3/ESR (CLE)-related protein 26 [Ipomoea nil]
MGSNLRSRKVSFYGSLLLVGLVGLLVVGALNMEETTTKPHHHHHQHSREREGGNMKHMSMQKDGDNEKPASSVHTDLNFMSKRKVPNGPDPIHNRRAGNSRRSPGRVYKGELDKP